MDKAERWLAKVLPAIVRMSAAGVATLEVELDWGQR
jgi:hypothetical protein